MVKPELHSRMPTSCELIPQGVVDRDFGTVAARDGMRFNGDYEHSQDHRDGDPEAHHVGLLLAVHRVQYSA